MRHVAWRTLGLLGFWVTWPLIWIYVRITPPRARIMIFQDDSILLVKNWLGTSHWVLPGGGIDKHEQPAQAVIREVEEELAMTLDPEKLIDLGLQTSHEKGGLRSQYYLFAIRLEKQPIVKPRAHEIMDFTWTDIKDLFAQDKFAVSTRDALQTWSEHQKML